MKHAYRQSLVNLAFLILIFFACERVFAQGSYSNLYNDFLTVKNRDAGYFDRVQGSPYDDVEFNKAQVFVKGDTTPIDAKMRYNIFFDEMEFKQLINDAVFLLDNKQEVDSILLNGEVIRFLRFIVADDTLSGFFKQIYNGECSLFLRKTLELHDEKIPTGGFEEYSPAKLTEKPDEFFIKFNNKPLIQLPTNKNKINDLFNENGYKTGYYSRIKYKEEFLIEFVKNLKKINK